MPYCCQCGGVVGEADAFCAHCGSQQAGVRSPAGNFFSNLTSRNASLLCYIPVVGWIPAIVVLASQRFKQDRSVRFHAFQGLYLFVAWLLVDWAIGPFFAMMPGHAVRLSITGILKAFLFFVWIFMIVKTSQNETYRLPVVGELADRSLSEQR
jgi:uncharacterized membrane protein